MKKIYLYALILSFGMLPTSSNCMKGVSAFISSQVTAYRYHALKYKVLKGLEFRRWLNKQLVIAAQDGELEAVKILLAVADINTRTEEKLATPLRQASQEGRASVAQVLLCAGADAAILDYEKSTPLLIASQYGHAGTVDVLLKHGGQPTINIPNALGLTPLRQAVQGGHEPTAKLLLEAGAQACFLDNEKESPLLIASNKGYVNIFDLLVKYGALATIDTPDTKGLRPLSVAVHAGHETISKRLLAAGANPALLDKDNNSPLLLASQRGELNTVDLLLRLGGLATIDTPNSRGLTPLRQASQQGHFSVVKRLCQEGAKADVRDKDGQTALMVAGKKGHTAIAQFLANKA